MFSDVNYYNNNDLKLEPLQISCFVLKIVNFSFLFLRERVHLSFCICTMVLKSDGNYMLRTHEGNFVGEKKNPVCDASRSNQMP